MKVNLQLSDIAERAIRTVAMRRGIPVEEVRREISLAILQSQPKDATETRAISSPEELVAYCVSRL